MMDLEKNRVYDTGEIEILKSKAVSLLDTGIEACLAWDDAVVQLRSLQSKTPIKHQELSSALEAAGKLYKAEYEMEKCWVEGALANIIENIPQQDIVGAELLEPLNENLEFVMGMIEDLAGCIEAAGTNQTLDEFKQNLEGIKEDWDETSLEENIEEFETTYLGMMENVEYFNDMFSSVDGFIEQSIDSVSFLSVYDAVAKLSDMPDREAKQAAIVELEKMYGFTEEEAILLYDAIEKLGESCDYEKGSAAYINYVYGTLSTLCISYDAIRWRMTAETPKLFQAKNRLYVAGFNSQQILDLQVLINLQHADFFYSDLMEANIDVTKSTFCNETHSAMMARCADPNNDFAHQTIQITELACEDMLTKEGGLLLEPWAIGLFNSFDFQNSYTRYEINFKGDIDSGRYSKADFQSGIDAINIYSRMRNDNEASLNHVWAEYYREVELGNTNRATEFFSNLGNGEENIGILELDNILKKETYGSEYIQRGNNMSKEDIKIIRSIFIRWIFSEYYGYEYEFPE